MPSILLGDAQGYTSACCPTFSLKGSSRRTRTLARSPRDDCPRRSREHGNLLEAKHIVGERRGLQDRMGFTTFPHQVLAADQTDTAQPQLERGRAVSINCFTASEGS